MCRSLTFIFLATCSSAAIAQLGGQDAFRILDVPISARSASLGGNYIAVFDNDLNLGLFQPGLLNESMRQQVALSYVPYIAGVNMGYAGYAHHVDSINATFAGSVQYVNYGTMTRTDATGAELGEFQAGEYVIQVGGGIPLDSLFNIGANVKFITSNLDTWNATAWAVDVGGVFHKASKGITVSALMRNLGYQSSTYTDTREKLPFQIQLGATYKFKHAPFRLGMMFEQLQQWDLTYEDPNAVTEIDPITGEVIEDKTTGFEKLMLHVVPSAEILLNEHFMLRVAYNYRRRQEMVLDAKPSLTGVSFGIGLKVSKLHVSYGYSQLNLAGVSNTFSIAARFADFRKG